MRHIIGSYWSLFLAGMLVVSAGDRALAGDRTETPPLPSKVRFNPAVMPEVAAAPASPLGWRYAKLSPAQTRVLRRGFKLPMDSLATASSPTDLVGAAVVTPLPDPNRPILAVDSAPAGSSDPFNKPLSASLRDDPMRALGQLLGADESSEMSTETFGGSGAADPFAAGTDTAGEIEAAPAEADEAGGTSDADPFATDGEDPFGDF